MAGLNVTLGDGTVVTIKAGEKIEDIKTRLGGNVDNIFEGLDSNTNGVLDENELAGLKTKLAENNYTVELAPDGKTPKKAFNDAMQNMRRRYDEATLKGYYMSGEADVWEIKYGDTLYDIAKETLEQEGLPTDFKSINDRIAQLANLNGINDVNNIRVGTKIIYKLTEEGVQKVKDAGNNSAAAFGGTAPVNHGGGGSNPVGGEGESNPSGGVNPEGGEEVTTPPVLEGKESTITVSPNGLNMGAGQYIDKDGNVLPDLNGDNLQKYKDGGSIMKYTSGDKVMYQTVYSEKAGSLDSGVKLTAETPEALRELDTKFKELIAKVKSAPENETEEAATARKAENLAVLKELVTITGGNIQVIRNVAEKLRDDNYVDRKSDDYKAFVQDILLTKNADALRALLYDADGNAKAAVLEYDKTAHEMVAGMYQEIRAKEKAGEMLSPEEIALKEVVADYKRKGGYEIEADEENGIYEKYMSYDNMDGTPMYQVKIDGNWYYAKDPALLDEFLTKLQAADTEEEKSALFKEYANTTDTELAKCLAENAKTLCAADEDVISLINDNGMVVLNKLPRPDDDIEYSKAVVDAVVSRMKEIYTTDKGNLENAVFLNNLEWVDKTDMSDEDKDKAKVEILETYFEVTTDEQGNKTYAFNPSRRPTYEEMDGLSHYTTSNMDLALLKYLKLEDMGKGQYSEVIENRVNNNDIRERYAEFVDGMQTKEEVIDFIDNKCSVYKNYNLPFDKILEKFPDDEDIKKRLFKEVGSGSTISDANRIALAKLCMKDVGKGNVTFDKTKLPEGTDIRHFIEYVLPGNCQKGDAKKYFEAAIKVFGKDDLERIAGYKEKNPDSVKARIGELVEENTSDNEFIQNVMKLDKSVIPFDIIEQIDAAQAKWDDKTKAAVFEGTFDGRVLSKDRAKHLEAAVNKHWITKVGNDLYAIGDTLYRTDYIRRGTDGEYQTEDDTVGLTKLSKTGYDHGVAMFRELEGAGSGDIAKMLRGKKEEGYENYITPDNITGILTGFNQMSPDEGIMEYIANEYGWSSGVKPGQALCNRIPKALMRKAAALGLQDTEAYKALADFFKPDEKFNFKQNDEAGERYDSDTAKQLDGLIAALLKEVLKKSGV